MAPNRINRRFHTNIPHQKITTDTTEFKYYQVDEKGKMNIKKLYLDPFMDMCNSEIVSFGISQRPSAESIMKALNEAITVTNDCPYRRTFHSDQGWAYQMKAYVNTLKAKKIFQSMSRKGNCPDNSVILSSLGILKSILTSSIVISPDQRIKCVGCHSSFSGKPYCSLPSAILFIRKVILRARVRIVWSPSKS